MTSTRDSTQSYQDVEDVDEVKNFYDLPARPRPHTQVEIQIPDDVLALLEELAREKGETVLTLISFYISNGLNADLEKQRYDRMLSRAAEVLPKHIDSAEDVDAIVEELRQVGRVSGPWRRAAR